jgi:hypothetical protein
MQLLIQSSDFVNINFYILAEQKYTLDMDNSNCSDFVTINFYIMAEQKYTSDMDNSNCWFLIRSFQIFLMIGLVILDLHWNKFLISLNFFPICWLYFWIEPIDWTWVWLWWQYRPSELMDSLFQNIHPLWKNPHCWLQIVVALSFLHFLLF